MKKKIYVCPKCGKALNFSDNPEYTFQCFECDEDFYVFEAKEVEQPRMEGVKDYTDLTRVSVEIKAITDKAIQESTRQIEIKGKDMIEQVCEYIYETINPILESGLHKEYKFRDHTRIYTSNFSLRFGTYLTKAGECQVQLFGENGILRVYFKVGKGYYIEQSGGYTQLAQEWQKLKDSMHRMIPYGIDEYNKWNQKRLEEQKAKDEIINSFKL